MIGVSLLFVNIFIPLFVTSFLQTELPAFELGQPRIFFEEK